jgi:hypothetical protein
VRALSYKSATAQEPGPRRQSPAPRTRSSRRSRTTHTGDPAQLLFMDEKGKNRYSTRRRWGRARYGERAIMIERFMRSSRHAYSFVAAADINGYVADACQLYWRPRPKGQERPGEQFRFANVTAAVFEFHMKYLVARTSATLSGASRARCSCWTMRRGTRGRRSRRS